jgi:hypothetical protein
VVNSGVCTINGEYTPSVSWTNSQNETYIRDFSSGIIRTTDDHVFKFVKYTSSIKMPGKGWWPAFWAWNHDEIDIMENFYDDTKYSSGVLSNSSNHPELSCALTGQETILFPGDIFHEFAMEYTPFKITFFYEGETTGKPIYRFYNELGFPVDVSCENPIIEEGIYYVNPAYPQSRKRGWKPTINLAVLPRYGLNCSGNECLDLSDCENNPMEIDNWGNPIDGNCQIVGDINTNLIIDFITVEERDYNICPSLLTYGPNCAFNSAIHIEPYSCSMVCSNEISSIYLEDINGKGWKSEVIVNSVSSSSNINILPSSDTNHEIRFINTSSNSGTITVEYTSNNSCSGTFTKVIEIDGFKFDYDILYLDECVNIAYIQFDSDDVTISKIEAISKWGQINQITTFDVSNEGLVTINWDNIYLIRELKIEVSSISCGITETISIPIEPCSDCCPMGYEYDGANCSSGIYFNDDHLDGQIIDGQFTTNTNCQVYPSNNCCPPNSTNINGICVFSDIPEHFRGFVYNGAFYTSRNCLTECCPDGFDFDGVNCQSGITFTSVIDQPEIIDNQFAISPNCNLYNSNNCCPPNSTFDGNLCIFDLKVPRGFTAGFNMGSFNVEPNCDSFCCPDGFEYDGANCFSGERIPEGFTPFIDGNYFYVQPDDIFGCPPGTSYDGIGCKYESFIPDGYNGFYYSITKGFYISKNDCIKVLEEKIKIDENIDKRNRGISLNQILKVFPNPAINTLNLVLSKKISQEGLLCLAYNLNGKLIYHNTFFQNENVIDVSTWNAGIYIIKIIDDNYTSQQKIIVTK